VPATGTPRRPHSGECSRTGSRGGLGAGAPRPPQGDAREQGRHAFQGDPLEGDRLASTREPICRACGGSLSSTNNGHAMARGTSAFVSLPWRIALGEYRHPQGSGSCSRRGSPFAKVPSPREGVRGYRASTRRLALFADPARTAILAALAGGQTRWAASWPVELARRAGPSRGHSLLHGWLMQRNPGVGSDRRWTVKGSELALALCSLDWLRRGARRGECGTVSSQPHLERGGRSITVTAGKEVEQRTTEQRERGGPLGQSGRG
jgi:hypothetical protein